MPRDLHQQGKWRQKLGVSGTASLRSLQYPPIYPKKYEKNPCFQKESDLQMILPSGYVKMDLSISFLYVYQRYQRVNGEFGILTLTSPIFWPCVGVIYLPQTHTHIKTYIDRYR